MNTKHLLIPLLASVGLFSPSVYADLPPAYGFKLLFSDFRGTAEPSDINAAGWVTGNTIYDTRPVLWKDNALVELNPDLQTQGTARGINNKGQIAGSLTRLGSPISDYQDAVVWTNGSPTRLGQLTGSISAQAHGINDAGVVVGTTQVPSGFTFLNVPTVWNGTTPTQLKSPFEGQYSEQGIAQSINNQNQIVGIADGHAMLWQGSQAVVLDPKSVDSTASSINDAGQIVGWRAASAPNGPYFATQWSNGNIISLGTLGHDSYSGSKAYDINNQGIIVGQSSDYESGVGASYAAVVWDHGQIHDLNGYLDAKSKAAGWDLIAATAVNDKGQIVGIAVNPHLDHSGSAFMLSPVPETGTYAMLIVGLCFIGIATRRRETFRNQRRKTYLPAIATKQGDLNWPQSAKIRDDYFSRVVVVRKLFSNCQILGIFAAFITGTT